MVSGFPSEQRGSGLATSPFTYSEQFKEVFPYYLSIGMTYDQFWNDDPEMAKFYREAAQLRNEQRNQEMWLQGLYIYDALCCASPIFHDFAKKGTKPAPYPKAPYPLTEREKKRDSEAAERRQMEKNKGRMEAIMAAVNRKFAAQNKPKEGRESNEHIC